MKFIAVTPDVAHALRSAAAPGSATTLGGMPVVIAQPSILRPSEVAMAGIDGRRTVRHGLAEVLKWLGEDVGPKPGAPAPMMAIVGDIADRFWGSRVEFDFEVDGDRERGRAWTDLPMSPTDALRGLGIL